MHVKVSITSIGQAINLNCCNCDLLFGRPSQQLALHSITDSESLEEKRSRCIPYSIKSNPTVTVGSCSFLREKLFKDSTLIFASFLKSLGHVRDFVVVHGTSEGLINHSICLPLSLTKSIPVCSISNYYSNCSTRIQFPCGDMWCGMHS